jgi:hypothetical protein
MAYKAKMRFSHGDKTFAEGQEVNLPEEQLTRLADRGLIAKGKGASEEEVKAEEEKATVAQSEKLNVVEKKEDKATVSTKEDKPAKRK